VFFVESEEEFALCPNCSGYLEYHSWVTRLLKDSTSSKSNYNIRVLKCGNAACPTKYHRELPDIIVPYKRYDTQSIEEAIELDNTDITVAADHSTIYRWRKWFAESMINIMMALLSVPIAIGEKAETSSLAIKKQNSNDIIDAIKGIVSRKAKWLNETVRILVNSSKWSFNRSAFLTG